jgi:hypothetical protein
LTPCSLNTLLLLLLLQAIPLLLLLLLLLNRLQGLLLQGLLPCTCCCHLLPVLLQRWYEGFPAVEQ